MGEPSLNLVETFDEAESFVRWLGERRQILAVDTETGGLEWWKDGLRLVQFGDLSAGWAIPWHLWSGLILDVLGRYEGDIVFHNLKFDLKYLEHHGVTLNRAKLHDTRAMAHIIDPTKPTGLKPLAIRLIDNTAGSGQDDLKSAMAKNGWTWATVPHDLPAYWVYSALDTVLTAHLYAELFPQIVTGFREVYELEIASTLVLNDMEVRGARIDLDYCEEKLVLLSTYADDMREWVQDNYNLAAGSNPAVAGRLQQEGVLLTKKTPSGAWSVDESVLAAIDHPLAAAVLNIRKATKTAKSYFTNFLDMADGEILHPDINPLGARTGRMSISRPALQQLPREALVRSAFIPRDGNRLLTIDFDQIEARLLTHFSRDGGLLAAFEAGGDFFTNMARLIYHDESITKADPRRQLTKSATYAKAYGAGASKFAETAGISEAEGISFIAQYDDTFRGVKRLQREIDAVAIHRYATEGLAYVTSPLGRRHPVDHRETYKLTNYLLQGTAADIFKQKLVELDRAGLTDHLILPVHDEVIFDVPINEIDEVSAAALEVLEDHTSFIVPLTAGAEQLERWGDKYA